MVETGVGESRRGDVCLSVCLRVCVWAKNPGIVEGGVRNLARGKRQRFHGTGDK